MRTDTVFRIVAVIALSTGSLFPTSAHAQFVKAPITIGNGVFTPPGGSDQAVSSPIHVGVGVPTGCSVGNGG